MDHLSVCMISSEYPPDSAGSGIGTYTGVMARGLAKAGHDVSVITRAVHGSETRSREDGVCVHRVIPARLPGLDGETFADAYLLARAVAARVATVASESRIDVIESPEFGARAFVLARSRLRIPHVVRLHTPLFLVNEIEGRRLSLGGRIVDAMERTTARRAVLATSPTRALAEIVASRFEIPRDRVRVIPNGIDHETFHPAPHGPSGGPTVLYAGKLSPRKGVLVLAEAIPLVLRRIPDARFVFIGSDHPMANGTGSCGREILKRLAEAGVASSVAVLPRAERAELVGLYQGAHVFVQPSLWENFAYTCLEALACGAPVVASGVGGLAEIIDDGRDGVLVPPNDPVTLADAIATLLANPPRRLEMGQAGRRKIVTTYTTEQIVARTVAVYREAIARCSTRGRPKAMEAAIARHDAGETPR